MTQQMTGTKVVRDDRYCSVVVDLGKSRVTTAWKGFTPGVVYREVLLQVHDAIREFGLQQWLSDSRKMGAIMHEETKWTGEVLTPMLGSSSLQKVAVLNSSDFIHNMAVGRMRKEAPPRMPYLVEFFDDPELALGWLKQD
jgi:hypothetical protein